MSLLAVRQHPEDALARMKDIIDKDYRSRAPNENDTNATISASAPIKN